MASCTCIYMNWHVVVMEKLEGVPLEGLDKSTKPQVIAVLDNLSCELRSAAKVRMSATR